MLVNQDSGNESQSNSDKPSMLKQTYNPAVTKLPCGTSPSPELFDTEEMNCEDGVAEEGSDYT